MVVPVGIVLSNDFMQEMLDNKVVYWLANYDFYIGLFKSTSTLADCNSTLANVVEADFDGYSPKPVVVWSAAAAVGGCVWRVQNDPVTWLPTGTTHPNTIGGYFVADGAAPKLLWWEWFSTGNRTVGGTLLPLTITPRMDEKRIV